MASSLVSIGLLRSSALPLPWISVMIGWEGSHNFGLQGAREQKALIGWKPRGRLRKSPRRTNPPNPGTFHYITSVIIRCVKKLTLETNWLVHICLPRPHLLKVYESATADALLPRIPWLHDFLHQMETVWYWTRTLRRWAGGALTRVIRT